MIDPVCVKCKKTFESYGGIMLSPPIVPISREIIPEGYTLHLKGHLCPGCCQRLEEWMSITPEVTDG